MLGIILEYMYPVYPAVLSNIEGGANPNGLPIAFQVALSTRRLKWPKLTKTFVSSKHKSQLEDLILFYPLTNISSWLLSSKWHLQIAS